MDWSPKFLRFNMRGAPAFELQHEGMGRRLLRFNTGGTAFALQHGGAGFCVSRRGHGRPILPFNKGVPAPAIAFQHGGAGRSLLWFNTRRAQGCNLFWFNTRGGASFCVSTQGRGAPTLAFHYEGAACQLRFNTGCEVPVPFQYGDARFAFAFEYGGASSPLLYLLFIAKSWRLDLIAKSWLLDIHRQVLACGTLYVPDIQRQA